MINAENFYEVVSQIDLDTLIDIMDSPEDYVRIQVVTFNGGYTVLCDSMDYSLYAEREALETGNLFCEKDDFERMLLEHGIDLDEFWDDVLFSY